MGNYIGTRMYRLMKTLKVRLELPNESQPDMLTELIENQREEQCGTRFHYSMRKSQANLKLFNQGLSDADIGNSYTLKGRQFNTKKSLIEDLKNKLKNFL